MVMASGENVYERQLSSFIALRRWVTQRANCETVTTKSPLKRHTSHAATVEMDVT